MTRALRDKARVRKGDMLNLSEQERAVLTIEGDDLFGEPDDRVAYDRMAKPLADLEAGKPPRALTLGGGLGRAYFLERGNPQRERDAMPPGFLTVLTCGRPAWTTHTWEKWATLTPERPLPQPRRALANWLTDVDEGAGRLVARVIVNRLWQHHFGEGLVRSPNDFGNQGERPSHPELLDWLAGELIEHGSALETHPPVNRQQRRLSTRRGGRCREGACRSGKSPG